jgi:hypothetical protein
MVINGDDQAGASTAITSARGVISALAKETTEEERLELSQMLEDDQLDKVLGIWNLLETCCNFSTNMALAGLRPSTKKSSIRTAVGPSPATSVVYTILTPSASVPINTLSPAATTVLLNIDQKSWPALIGSVYKLVRSAQAAEGSGDNMSESTFSALAEVMPNLTDKYSKHHGVQALSVWSGLTALWSSSPGTLEAECRRVTGDPCAPQWAVEEAKQGVLVLPCGARIPSRGDGQTEITAHGPVTEPVQAAVTSLVLAAVQKPASVTFAEFLRSGYHLAKPSAAQEDYLGAVRLDTASGSASAVTVTREQVLGQPYPGFAPLKAPMQLALLAPGRTSYRIPDPGQTAIKTVSAKADRGRVLVELALSTSEASEGDVITRTHSSQGKHGEAPQEVEVKLTILSCSLRRYTGSGLVRATSNANGQPIDVVWGPQTDFSGSAVRSKLSLTFPATSNFTEVERRLLKEIAVTLAVRLGIEAADIEPARVLPDPEGAVRGMYPISPTAIPRLTDLQRGKVFVVVVRSSAHATINRDTALDQLQGAMQGRLRCVVDAAGVRDREVADVGTDDKRGSDRSQGTSDYAFSDTDLPSLTKMMSTGAPAELVFSWADLQAALRVRKALGLSLPHLMLAILASIRAGIRADLADPDFTDTHNTSLEEGAVAAPPSGKHGLKVDPEAVLELQPFKASWGKRSLIVETSSKFTCEGPIKGLLNAMYYIVLGADR